LLQEYKNNFQVKMSPLKCCIAKSATQISIQLRATQVSGDLSGVLAIRPKNYEK